MMMTMKTMTMMKFDTEEISVLIDAFILPVNRRDFIKKAITVESF